MDLRRRIPFKVNKDTEDEATILDDQEQEQLLETLRHENTKSNEQAILMMQLLVLLSAILHLIYFVNPTDDPLLHLFPQDPSHTDRTIPLPRAFTLVSLFLHANLMLLLDPTSIRKTLMTMGIGLDNNIDLRSYALSPTLSYTLALVAPSICLFLRRSWITVAWWSITIVISYTVQLVFESISAGNERITSLEAMRYTAPGA